MLLLIKETDALPQRNTFITYYGQPGTGKTSLGFTSENPLHLDFDEGLSRCVFRKASLQFENELNDRKKVIKTGYTSLKEAITKGDFGKIVADNDFKTVVIDTGGTLLDNHIAEHLMMLNSKYRQADGSLTLKGYGALKVEFKWLKNRLKELKLDIILICHATEKDNYVRPKMTGSSIDVVKEVSDMMGYVYIEGDLRIVDFNPTEKSFGKNMAALPKLTIPHYEDEEYATFAKRINDACKEKMSKLTQAQLEAIEIMDKFEDKVDACKTEKALVKLEKDLVPKLSVTFKAQAKEMIKKRSLQLLTESWDLLTTVEEFNAEMKKLSKFTESRRKVSGLALVEFGKVEKQFEWYGKNGIKDKPDHPWKNSFVDSEMIEEHYRALQAEHEGQPDGTIED